MLSKADQRIDRRLTIIDEFSEHALVLQNLNFREASARLAGLVDWMEQQPPLQNILAKLQKKADGLAILLKAQWCEVRTTIFDWTRTPFPLHIRSTRRLMLNAAPIITLIDKPFWDKGHAPKDQSNHRKNLRDTRFERFIPSCKWTC